MSFYEVCEYCPIFGEVRERILPFGNAEGEIAVIIPHFTRLSTAEKADLVLKYPTAFFIGFLACRDVENLEQAELSCSILLRNTVRDFYKLLIYDSPILKSLFSITAESLQRDDGVKFGTYKGRVGEKDFNDEYMRLSNG